MRSRLALVTVGLLVSGCAGIFSPAPSGLLARADDRLAAAEYRSAVALYDEFLQANPSDSATSRARATRAVVERLLLSQGEIERLRRELAAQQAEIDRLKAETSRLRADLERLRSIDLRQTPPPR